MLRRVERREMEIEMGSRDSGIEIGIMVFYEDEKGIGVIG